LGEIRSPLDSFSVKEEITERMEQTDGFSAVSAAHFFRQLMARKAGQ